MIKKIKFDVMLRDRFIATLRMPITPEILEGWDGDDPVIKSTAFDNFVAKKLPTLKGEPLRIFLY